MMMYNDFLYGSYRNKKFTDVYNNSNDFVQDVEDYIESVDLDYELPLKYIFTLLYARYGNSTIANSDLNQFKYKLFTTITMYGPTWAKKLDIQKKIISLTEDEIMKGNGTVYTHSFNPGQEDTNFNSETLEGANYINEKDTTYMKRNKLNALNDSYASLHDITEAFVNQFKNLFLVIVNPELPLFYESEVDE